MASALSDYTEGKLLAWLKGTTFPTAPTDLYIGLFTTLPADTGTSGSPADGTEVSGNSYARVSLTAASDWSAIAVHSTTGQHITNSNDITFPEATGSWGTIVGYGVWDASTAGNLIFYGSLSSSTAINANATPTLAAGQIDLSVD